MSELTNEERAWFSSVISEDRGLPDLEGVWTLMDTAWDECGCDPDVIDERIDRFYAHPVWLLNGIFIEQHAESLINRRVFAEYVAGLAPERVADFGGGYGTLARMIGSICPDVEVHIVEPHPHEIAMSLAGETDNVSYVAELSGHYDVLLATDVFEHVPDPLGLVEETAAHLCLGGHYLIANCFWPVIRCHLPSTFHLRWSWNAALMKMNLKPEELVSYGRSFKRTGPVSATSARKLERRSAKWFRLIEKMKPQYRKYLLRVLFGKL